MRGRNKGIIYSSYVRGIWFLPMVLREGMRLPYLYCNLSEKAGENFENSSGEERLVGGPRKGRKNGTVGGSCRGARRPAEIRLPSITNINRSQKRRC